MSAKIHTGAKSPSAGSAIPCPPRFAACLSRRDLDADLLFETGTPLFSLEPLDAFTGNLHVMEAGSMKRPLPWWSQNTWLSGELVEYASIGDAARKLRAIQRNWIYCPVGFNRRRAALIEENLPPISRKPRDFPFDLPDAKLGSFCLLDESRMLVSADCSSPFPNGAIEFVENKIDPPSRAYLKLQEAFTLSDARPGPGSRCVDAGACPGGWTWVLLGLGAEVVAIDRAPLDPRLMSNPRLEYLQHSAFTLKPAEIGRIDWLCSDVICYPPKLYEWVMAWLDSGLCGNFVCTLKMQGECDWESLKLFSEIKGSRIVHLWNNKHEVTWIRKG